MRKHKGCLAPSAPKLRKKEKKKGEGRKGGTVKQKNREKEMTEGTDGIANRPGINVCKTVHVVVERPLGSSPEPPAMGMATNCEGKEPAIRAKAKVVSSRHHIDFRLRSNYPLGAMKSALADPAKPRTALPPPARGMAAPTDATGEEPTIGLGPRVVSFSHLTQ